MIIIIILKRKILTWAKLRSPAVCTGVLTTKSLRKIDFFFFGCTSNKTVIQQLTRQAVKRRNTCYSLKQCVKKVDTISR